MNKIESNRDQNRASSHIERTHPVSAIASSRPPSATDCDVLVVGGGINGGGIARDLAGRGLARGAVREGRPGRAHLVVVAPS